MFVISLLLHCSLWLQGVCFVVAFFAAMGRGGDRKCKVADLDLSQLIEEHVLEVGIDAGLAFGAYEHISRTHAVFTSGLVFNKDILKKVPVYMKCVVL